MCWYEFSFVVVVGIFFSFYLRRLDEYSMFSQVKIYFWWCTELSPKKSFFFHKQSKEEENWKKKKKKKGEFFFFFFFFAFPSYISGVHHSGWEFCVCDRFFNPTIQVVTFRLRGWCVLGVFFVAGIHPSRTWTSRSFESVRWNACLHRLDLGLYSHPKEFWGNGVWTHVNSKGKIPSTENVPRGGSNPRRCGQRAQALPTELFRPPKWGS